MRWAHMAVIGFFVVVIVVFAAQNLQMVDVAFLSLKVHTRLAFLIAVIYLLGAVTGGSLFALLRRSFEGARQRPAVHH